METQHYAKSHAQSTVEGDVGIVGLLRHGFPDDVEFAEYAGPFLEMIALANARHGWRYPASLSEF